MLDLREKIFKKLFYKKIIKNNPNQSDIKYEESIAERTKLRRQAGIEKCEESIAERIKLKKTKIR